jgi:xylulokinase
MESIAYMLRSNIELLEGLGITVKEVRSTGGAARSRLWNQIKADVLQKPILTVHCEETAALGVAMLAGVAAGIFDSVVEATRSMVSIRDRLMPSETSRDVYDRRYSTYVRLYKAVEKLF